MKNYFTLSKYNQESPYLSPKSLSKSLKKINSQREEIAEQKKNKEISLKCFLINDLKKLSKIDKKFNLLGQKSTSQKILSKEKKIGLSSLDDKCQIYLNQMQLKLSNHPNQKNQHESNPKKIKQGITKARTQNDVNKLSHQARFRIYNKYGTDKVYQNIQEDQKIKLQEPKTNKKNKKMLIDQKLDEIHNLALQKLNEEKYKQSKVLSKNKPRILIDNDLIDRIVFEESMEQDSSEDSIDSKKQGKGIKMKISQSHESESLNQQIQKDQINTRDSEKQQSRSSPITISHTPITQEEKDKRDQNCQISDLKDFDLPQQKQKQSFQRKNLKRSQTQYQQLKRKQLTFQNY